MLTDLKDFWLLISSSSWSCITIWGLALGDDLGLFPIVGLVGGLLGGGPFRLWMVILQRKTNKSHSLTVNRCFYWAFTIYQLTCYLVNNNERWSFYWRTFDINIKKCHWLSITLYFLNLPYNGHTEKHFKVLIWSTVSSPNYIQSIHVQMHKVLTSLNYIPYLLIGQTRNIWWTKQRELV